MASVKKVGERKYLVRVSSGTGALRQFHNKTLKCTLAEANQYAREIESQLSRGRSPFALKTVLEYSEHWLSRKACKDSTRDFYADMVRLYAEPLHQTPLFKLTSNHIQSVYDRAEVSSNTVRHLHSTLRAMLNYAVKKRHLTENPCNFVDVPKRVKPVVEYWDEHDAMRFLAACANAPHGLVFEFALETGARPGEYIALKKEDVSFGRVSITKSIQRKSGKKGSPKTYASRRSIPLSEPLLAKLEAIDHEHELLFCTGLGTHLSQANLQKEMDRIIKKIGVKQISLYGLRHTMATLMLLGNENPKVVSERLGHASVTLTLDTYSHVLPNIQEAATDRLSVMLRGSAHNMHTQNLDSSDLIN